MISVQPIAGALGAEISGVNLAKDLGDETIAAIRRAWLEHLVVFFRDQELTPRQFLDFGRRFGQPIEYPFVSGLPETPEVIAVLKLEHEAVNFGGIWHSDILGVPCDVFGRGLEILPGRIRPYYFLSHRDIRRVASSCEIVRPSSTASNPLWIF